MKEKYNVTGMTCSACVSHVEKAVKAVSGVKEVNVNLLSNSMTVSYDSDVSSEMICRAVESAGYGASPAKEKTTQKTEETKNEEHT